MQESSTDTLICFTRTHALTNAQAAILPALFDHAGEKLQQDPDTLATLATFGNAELGHYFAKVARNVAEQMEKEPTP